MGCLTCPRFTCPSQASTPSQKRSEWPGPNTQQHRSVELACMREAPPQGRPGSEKRVAYCRAEQAERVREWVLPAPRDRPAEGFLLRLRINLLLAHSPGESGGQEERSGLSQGRVDYGRAGGLLPSRLLLTPSNTAGVGTHRAAGPTERGAHEEAEGPCTCRAIHSTGPGWRTRGPALRGKILSVSRGCWVLKHPHQAGGKHWLWLLHQICSDSDGGTLAQHRPRATAGNCLKN